MIELLRAVEYASAFDNFESHSYVYCFIEATSHESEGIGYMSVLQMQYPKKYNMSRNLRKVGISIESFKPLVAMKAREAYFRLPKQTRQWLDLEDMISEGVIEALTYIASYFDPERNVKFTTLLYSKLDHFFRNYTEGLFAQKRWQGRDMSIGLLEDTTEAERVLSPAAQVYQQSTTQAQVRQIKKRGHGFENGVVVGEGYISTAYFSDTGVELNRVKHGEEIELELVAVDAFVKMYAIASSSLRQHLLTWFIKPATKFQTHNAEHKQMRKEFRKLAKHFHFTSREGAVFSTSYTCRVKACWYLLSFRTIIKKGRDRQPFLVKPFPPLNKSLEYQLLPIIAKYQSETQCPSHLRPSYC